MRKINYHQGKDLQELVELRKNIEYCICKKHTGKMEGFWSLSTSVIDNEFCQIKQKCAACVCSKCYAEALLKCRSNQAKKLHFAYELLTKAVYPLEAFPVLNVLMFRFESFGDLATAEQAINYFQLCRANPAVTFTLWTKNPWLIQEAIDAGERKPENLIIIYSSPRLNVPEAPRYDFIDKVFTVYTADYAIENDVNINCGSADCKGCRRCYDLENSERYVSEMLKQEQSKYYKAVGI